MNRLNEKRALVTGGTSGIGFETAKQLLAEGARVAITGRSADALAAARSELGPNVVAIQADAGNVADQKKIAKAVADAFGKLDVVFVNAGMGEFRPLDAWDEEAFDKSVATNVKGPFFLLQALLPILSNPASIVLNTSINAHIGMPTSSVYALTKAALLTLARTLSGELLGRGIRVNAISPGPVTTALHGKIGMSQSDLEGLRGQIPLGRFGTSTEIAKAVVFLASDESAYTVGSELIIDGGMSTL